VNIPVDNRGKAKGVVFIDENNNENIIQAKVVVLSAGALESPRLLLNSASHVFPDGLANRSGVVGRYFMETIFHSTAVMFEEPIHSYKGLQIDARCWDFNMPDPKQSFQAGVVFGVSALGLLGPLAYAKYLVQGWGKSHKDQMREYFGRTVYLFSIGEQHPHQDNRISLDPTERDRFGIPVAKITTKLSPNDLEMINFMANQENVIVDAARAKKVLGAASAYDQSTISHMSGTCRMGSNLQKSVVNGFCQSHDVQNLFIVDASCFVTEGGGDSPSLTIQAIALRAGDYLVEEARKGDL
jgi:choline dehydrogenase-like flavoprotein